MTAPTDELTVEFAGEAFTVGPDAIFTVGREGDLAIDDNLFLHRHFLTIEKHDFEFKMRNARKFLLENDKLKVTMVFRGREITHAEIGEALLKKVAQELADVGTVESGPRLEGKSMFMLLAPTNPAPKKKEKDAKSEDVEPTEGATASGGVA